MKKNCLLFILQGVVAVATPFTNVAHANPEGGKVSDGAATIMASGKKLDVHQHTDKAVIDWRSFNIESDEHTQFHQPSGKAITLNRVNSHNPSHIMGRLSANGNVVIINPDGVFFGKDSKVDVNGLIATTADIDNKDFMAGKLHFVKPGKPDAAIINQGHITAKEAGLVALVAPNVSNHGVITARLGRVELASGDRVVIDLYGDGLYELKVNEEVASQLVSNTGHIDAEGGTIAITAAAGKEIVNSLVSIEGELKAPTVGKKGGKIIIAAEGSNAVAGNKTSDKGKRKGQSTVTVANATIDASGRNVGEQGGGIDITADKILLTKATHLDASGYNGGGDIRIGGDYQGLGEIPTAFHTTLGSDVWLNASALNKGNAGTAIIWSDGNTYFSGTILAQGGAESGDGGFVEVSGKNYLKYKGYVNTLAANGETGLLLLDPADIVVLNGTGDGDDVDGSSSSTNATVAAGDAVPTQIYESELEGIASGTAISLTSSNSITINDLTDNTLNLDQNVTFSTGTGGFTMNTGDAISSTGSITVTTTGGSSTIGSLAGNGNKTLNIGGTADVSGVISGTGTLTKTGTGTLTLSGNNTYGGTTTLTTGTIAAGSNTALGTGTLSLNGGTLSASGAARTLANAVSLANNSTIGGSLDLTLNGTFTNTNNRTLTVNNSSLTTLGGTVNLSNSGTNRTLTIAGTGNVAMNGTVQNGSTSTASAITKTGASTLTLSGNNTYAGTTTLTTGTITAGSNTALGTGTLSLNGGTLSASGAARTLTNAVSLANSSTIGGSLDLTLNGTFTNTNNRTLTVNNSSLTTLGGTVNLSNSGTNYTLTVAGTGNVAMNGTVQNGSTSTASAITKTGANTLTLSGNNTYAGTTTLTTGTIAAGSNTALGTGTLSLNGGTLSASGAARTLTNAVSLANNSTIGGSLDLTLNGTFTNTNNRTLTVNNSGLTTLDGTVNLSNSATNRTLTIAGTGNMVMGGTVQNGSTSTASAITKTGTGTLTLSGNNTYAGTTAINGGTLRLGNANRISNSSAVTVDVSGIFDLNGYSETVASLTNNGAVILGTGNTLTTTTAQTHSGTITGNGVTLASTGGGNITANNVLNDFTGNLTISTTGTASIFDANSLALGTVSANTFTTRALNGDLTLNGQINAAATSGNSINLQATDQFINNFGATALQTAGTARFLVFSNDSTQDTRGSLAGFNRYGCSYNVGAPSCAGGTDIPASGNGFYFAQAPTLTITGITANNKTYDATTTATISGVGTPNGVLNGDAVSLNSASASFAFVNKNVGVSKTVNGSGYALSGVNFGYILSQPVLTADITRADLNVTGLTASNKIYDGLTAATLGGSASVSPLGSDSVTLNGTAIGTFANKNVGSAKAVTVTGLSLSGGDAGNYTLLQQAGLTADIMARPLTISTITADNKAYDGTTTAVISAYAFDDAIAGDDISMTGIAGAFDTPSAGINKTVTVNAGTLAGADGGNYAFSLGSATDLADITAVNSPLDLPSSALIGAQNPILVIRDAGVFGSGGDNSIFASHNSSASNESTGANDTENTGRDSEDTSSDGKKKKQNPLTILQGLVEVHPGIVKSFGLENNGIQL